MNVWGVANGVTVNAGYADIFGATSDVTVTNGGSLYVKGTADNIKFAGGKLEVLGTATKIAWTPCEGELIIRGAATATFTSSYSGVYYGSGGKMLKNAAAMDAKTVDSASIMYVMDGGLATNTTVDTGHVYVWSGGVASGATVNPNGVLFISSGGTASGATVNPNGVLFISSGGTATGQMTFAAGAIVKAYEGGVIDFDISGITPDNAALLNNLSVITEKPTFTLTVSGTQADGVYSLAGGAYYGFDSTITVVNKSGSELCTLTVDGGTVEIGDTKYTLALNDEDELTVTVGDLTPINGPEEPLNNYLYDAKKAKEDPPEPVLNTNVTEEYGNYLRTTHDEICLDQIGTVDSAGYHNHVGADDVTDFAKLTLEHGARVSFDLFAMDATEFTIWSLTSGTDKKGNTTYTQKSLQATTLKKAKNATDYTYAAQTKNLFLEAGEYYVSMQSTNAKKGGNALYNVTVNGEIASKNCTIIYDDGDDGWNNYLYDKKQDEPLNPDRFDFMTTHITSGMLSEVLLDSATSHADETGTWKNFVGFGDATDFARIQLDCGASISFAADATDASKFTIWQLVTGEDKKGNTTYTQKSLQATTLKLDKKTGLYSMETKPLLLEAGDYYISMQSTNASKGGSAYYGLSFDEDESVFYSDADGGWNNYLYDSKTKTLNPDKDYFMTTEIYGGASEFLLDSGVSHADETGTWNNFAGFGDDTDFGRFYLYHAADLCFTVNATDAAKFTIWQLVEGEDKKGNTTYTQKSLQATTLKYDKKTELYSVNTKGLLLEKGYYYISVESTNAKKGGSAYYSIALNQADCEYYGHADDGWNNYLCDSKTKTLNPDSVNFKNTNISAGAEVRLDSGVKFDEGGTLWYNFAGFTDASDFAQITLDSNATLSFALKATDATKFTIWRLDEKEDKKGNTVYTQKALQATTLKKDKETELFMAETKLLSLDAGVYYVSMESTNASKGGHAYYEVKVDSFIADDAVASALAMPESELALGFAETCAGSATGLLASL